MSSPNDGVRAGGQPLKSIPLLFTLILVPCLLTAAATAQTPTTTRATTDETLSGAPPASRKMQPAALSPQTLGELRQLGQAALSSDYAYRQVAHLTNNIGPRLSGSAQAARAVEFVSGELKKLGCEVSLEKVMVPHWVRGAETGELVLFPGQVENTTHKIVLCALGPSVATPAAGLTADVIVTSSFAEFKNYPREQIQGKIVLVDYRFDKQMAAEGRGGDAYSEAVEYRSDGPAMAARQGAVACLVRSVGGAEYRLPHTGYTRYVDGVPKIPAAAVTAEDADLLADLVRQGEVKMKLVLTPQTLPDAESHNVIADLKGTQHPDEVVIVSGHLDSWDLGTGAIDDAAGVGVSMEAVNLITKLHLRPKRTIRVVAWMNEENGSAGGKQYGVDYADKVAQHFAAIETDGGAGHPTGVSFKAAAEVKSLLAPMSSVLQEFGAGVLAMSDHSGADLEALDKAGVPTFAPIQDSRFYFNYHHSAADTLDKVDRKELAENAIVVAITAYALANLEMSLPRVSGTPTAVH